MSKKLKIAHLSSMHEWDDDRIFQRACVGLARLGHELHFVGLKPEKQPFDKQEYLGVSLHLQNRKSGWKRRWYSSKEVVLKAITLNCDVYQFHDPDLLPHIGLIQKARPNAVLVYDIHENYAGRFSNWGLPSFLGNWFRAYEKSKLKKINGFTVVSESMKSLFQGVKTPVEITRNSTDIQRLRDLDFSNQVKSDKSIVITSGTHSHARNCLQTVAAMKFMPKEVLSETEFQFVGRYIDGIEKELLAQAKADETDTFLKLDGMAPWEENFQRLAKAYCGCVFYADNPNNRVGIPNRLFEYMYCGLPVVASNFPELRNVIEKAKCGLVVDSEDPKEIAKGLTTLLSKPELASEMGRNGKKAMEEVFGYHIDLQNLEKFYYRLLS